MNIHTLQQEYPKAFERAHASWVSSIEYDWWAEPVEAEFAEDMKSLGLTVNAIYFDREAAVEATMPLTKLMEHLGLTAKYYPLYLAAISDNPTITFRPHFGYSYQRFPDINFHACSYVPVGIFSDLSQEAWNELIESQIAAEAWSKLAFDWIRPYLTQLMRDLDNAYDYVCSEDSFLEACDTNEYQFNKEGEWE